MYYQEILSYFCQRPNRTSYKILSEERCLRCIKEAILFQAWLCVWFIADNALFKCMQIDHAPWMSSTGQTYKDSRWKKDAPLFFANVVCTHCTTELGRFCQPFQSRFFKTLKIFKKGVFFFSFSFWKVLILMLINRSKLYYLTYCSGRQAVVGI